MVKCCKDCVFCVKSVTERKKVPVYVCSNPDLLRSARAYEKRNGGSIVKGLNVIGNRMIKTSIKWCPYRNSEGLDGGFDVKDVIIDPSMLVQGEKYYVGDSLQEISNAVTTGKEPVEYKGVDTASRMIALDTQSVPHVFWYHYVKPIVAFEPYGETDPSWLRKTVVKKSDESSSIIVSLLKVPDANGNSLCVGVDYVSLADFYKNYLWADETPCGRKCVEGNLLMGGAS